jgi:hypothetical protein
MKRFNCLMNKAWIVLTLAVTTSLQTLHLQAQELTADSPTQNWFSVGPQFGLNITGRFKHVGNLNSAAGPATGGGINRDYNDGFVHVDSSGNAGGQTWNWGYQNSGQLQGNTVTMHSSSDTTSGAMNQDNNLGAGFDVAFGRNLGAVLGGKWGLQAAFDFTSVSIHNSHPFSGTGTTISDAYSLGGVTAPQAPYAGSFDGPGALLGDSPTRTTTSETISITGSRTLEAQVYALRLGPYFEAPVWKRWSARVGGGLVLAVADLQYSFNETITYGSGQVINKSGSSSGADFQTGAYLEGKILFAINPRLSLYAGAQYEYLGTFSRKAGGEQAQLDMSSKIGVLFGAQWNF